MFSEWCGLCLLVGQWLMSSIFIINVFATWSMLMSENHFRKTAVNRRARPSTPIKSNITWVGWINSIMGDTTRLSYGHLDSSKGDLVTAWLSHRVVFETFDQSNVKTWPDQQQNNDKDIFIQRGYLWDLWTLRHLSLVRRQELTNKNTLAKTNKQ